MVDEDASFQVAALSVEKEEERIAEKIRQEQEDAAANEQQSRVKRLREEQEALQKDIEELIAKHPTRTKELSSKRRKLVDVKLRVESAEAAFTAHQEIQEIEENQETERERLIRIGLITPFQGQAEFEKRKKTADTEDDPGQKEDGAQVDTVVPSADIVTKTEDLDDAEDLQVSPEDAFGDEEFEGGLRVPGAIYQRLFPYQRIGVRWMWELHCQQCGGIIGDEMGLGKTIQVWHHPDTFLPKQRGSRSTERGHAEAGELHIPEKSDRCVLLVLTLCTVDDRRAKVISFLAALDYSNKLSGPVLVVVPATLLRQWQREISAWWPSFEAQILHQSDQGAAMSTQGIKKAIGRAQVDKGVVITTYEMVRRNRDVFIQGDWMYAVLDEGHRIRNPDSDITLACKQINTPHRIVMTGSPLQNRLRELWSLFDFVLPGRMGTLPVFEREFSIPIATGGYATASAAQIHTAYHCAVILRDLITPYILRRMKKDIALQLPEKREQILLCRLTEEQKEKYKAYLSSRDVRLVLNREMNMLAAVTVLRKICNHPDLVEKETMEDYGNWRRSGKLRVVNNVLHSWHKDGSRVLLFAQTTTLLDLLEKYVREMKYTYLRMDGSTAVSKRMAVIDQFNTDENVFLFLLTTKVGGFGVNLTGANKVILYEPDWNPSNDLQARERAWRIGQKRDVTVYRLVTRGTIEEKIYHRQIYKQFLTSKVLNDPKQRRFFKARDLNNLFTYTDEADNTGTETGDLFVGTGVHEVTRRSKIDDGDDGSEPGLERDKEDDENEEDSGDGSDRDGKKGDSKILQDIFKSDGLHSAIDHDLIMRAGEATVDLDIIQHEATRIAQQAAKELRQSRRERLEQSVSVPTWTGRSGLAGRPDVVRTTKFGRRDGKASSLLSNIRERAGNASATKVDENVQLMDSIREFLASKGGQATTLTIVDHFKDKVGGKSMITFKALLQRVARMQKNSTSGVAMWTLSAEFA